MEFIELVFSMTYKTDFFTHDDRNSLLSVRITAAQVYHRG